MAYDKVIDSAQLEAQMTDLADTIRKKCNSSEKLVWPDGYQTAIEGLSLENPQFFDGMDPDTVYRTTRPKDWLALPIPGDDEIYLLGLIPEGADGVFTAEITFSGSCGVEIGNLVNGEFTAKETVTPTSNTRFYHTLYGNDYGDITSDGCKQYIVRISGSVTQAALHPESIAAYSFGVPMIVDAIIGKDANILFGNNTTLGDNCNYLRYARFVGNGSYGTGLLNFRYCQNLLSVSMEKKSTASSMNYFFNGCKRLMAVSENVFPENASYNYTFQDACIPAFPPNLKLTPNQSITGIFRGSTVNYRMDFTDIDFSKCGNFTYLVYGSNIQAIENLDISGMTNTMSMFNLCKLIKLTFSGETTPGGWTIALENQRMSHKALVAMIHSLPMAIAEATITLTGNPGASALTDAEIAVATAKNWTVTV